MRHILVTSLIAGTVLGGCLHASADQGKRISDPEMGISFRVPEGWKAVKQGGGYLMGSDTLKGFILILPHGYPSLDALGAEAEEGILDEDSGILLYPASELKKFGGNGLQGEFRGTIQQRDAAAFAVGLLSPKGGGVTILSAVESSSFTDAYRQLARSIASSLTFGAQATAGGGTGGGGAPAGTGPATDASLMRYFQGKYYSYSGGSTLSGGAGTERRVMLCANGHFFDSSEFSAQGTGDWGAVSTSRGRARWAIQGDRTRGVITIIRPDGSTQRVRYQVTGESGVILFDGITFAFEGAAECGN